MSTLSAKSHLNSDPMVSVIIPTYGRPTRLPGLLQTLLAQEAAGISYEIIVVDDGSPEPIESVVTVFTKNTKILMKCLRKENGGPASARNFGAKAAAGEYLLFVDDDMCVGSDLIRGHIETHQRYGPAVVTGEFEWQIDGPPSPFRRWHSARVRQWMGELDKHKRFIGDGIFEFPDSAASCNLSLRRADFQALGGLDSGYAYGACEDQEFARQLQRKGLRTLMTGRTKSVHLETFNSLEKLCRRQRNGAEDTVRWIRRLAITENFGQQEIERVNGPLKLGIDSWSLVGKKLVKQIITLPPLAPIFFNIVAVVERLFPNSTTLPRFYELIVGAYIQKGWRDGLKKHKAVMPLEEWHPIRAKQI